jgi:hypothetical protein
MKRIRWNSEYVEPTYTTYDGHEFTADEIEKFEELTGEEFGDVVLVEGGARVHEIIEKGEPTKFSEALVGFVTVDSGALALGDPGSVEKLADMKAGEKLDAQRVESAVYGATIDACSGLVVSTGYGDGYYPVYVTTTPCGRVARVEVEFISEAEAREFARITEPSS